MLYLTIGLFALAAIIGITILKNWVTSSNTSRTVVYAHGLFAAAALVMLLVHILQNPSQILKASIVLFGIAAIGGFYMFFQDMRKKISPTWLAVTHGLLAVGGFILLLLTII
jgi:uncharacterized phage infection (PIP) family protein YhgE